jgi:serine/threonine protein kinase
VRLADLVNSVGSNFREVANFIRYPFQNLSRIATRHAQKEYENVELPWGKKTETRENSVEQSNIPVEKRNSQADRMLNPYSPQELLNESNARTSQVKVASSSLNEIANAVTIAAADRLARKTSPSAKTLPILPTDIEIRGGRRGKYRVEKCLKDGETVRLYQGIQVENNKPILIKEYLLTDRDFNQKEAKERKEKFEKLASLNLKNGVGQDFRLISPWDAIAPSNEKRCYLIFEQPVHNSLTLREYLLKSGAMTPHQVRGVLDQVLQTLWFLHSHRLRTFDDDIEQGLPHGYLSLDSLLIASSSQPSALDKPQFFIYVADLALWEDLFKPPTAKFSERSPKQDLIDLGYVSFYLLWGTTVDPDTAQPLNPKFEQHWPEFKDARLNKFIHRLLGIDQPFKTAFEARKELLAPLSRELETPLDVTAEADSLEEDTQKSSSLFRLVLTIILFGFLGGLLLQIMVRLRQPLSQVEQLVFNSSEPCCLAQIEQVPTETVTYITEADGMWSYILNTVSLVSYNKTFVEELSIRDRD